MRERKEHTNILVLGKKWPNKNSFVCQIRELQKNKNQTVCELHREDEGYTRNSRLTGSEEYVSFQLVNEKYFIQYFFDLNRQRNFYTDDQLITLYKSDPDFSTTNIVIFFDDEASEELDFIKPLLKQDVIFIKFNTEVTDLVQYFQDIEQLKNDRINKSMLWLMGNNDKNSTLAHLNRDTTAHISYLHYQAASTVSFFKPAPPIQEPTQELSHENWFSDYCTIL